MLVIEIGKPFNQDEEQNPPAKGVALKKRIRATDAILFVTPEYKLVSVFGSSSR
jgi:NAD(P)H-dependent FMN reductase